MRSASNSAAIWCASSFLFLCDALFVFTHVGITRATDTPVVLSLVPLLYRTALNLLVTTAALYRCASPALSLQALLLTWLAALSVLFLFAPPFHVHPFVHLDSLLSNACLAGFMALWLSAQGQPAVALSFPRPLASKSGDGRALILEVLPALTVHSALPLQSWCPVFAAWFSAYFLALDHGTRWQRFPIAPLSALLALVLLFEGLKLISRTAARFRANL